MADIQLKTFEQQRFYKVDNTLALILVALNLAGPIPKDQPQQREDTPPPDKPTFSVVLGPQGTALLMLHKPTGERLYFSGNYNSARDYFKVMVWSGEAQTRVLTGPEPSAEILEEYRKVKNQESQAKDAAHNLAVENAAKRGVKVSI
jgi:hypothetical protein